ncbi:peptidase A1 [Pyrenophora seminiperda CCB06]|uniref:Peptidase A1 n=1 Tax=Pyrenophora seminiperda CCB06 TaxID=1302712 RepID=A0A3M7LZA8_9PLEO|nr:peptidase A1 [Pyrenophora seminiperda CCB06]
MAEIEPASTTTPAPTPRIAYIRTTSSPDWWPEAVRQTLVRYVKQEDPLAVPPRPRHRFLFGASTAADASILDLFLLWLPPRPNPNRYFRDLRKSDLEVRVSHERAETPDGRRLLSRCASEDVCVVVSGKDDDECTEQMLGECDYIIDEQTTIWDEWFWNTARTGIPQDSMLTNPEYDVKQHDYSKHRLGNRYRGYAWRASSGGFHGNYDWICRGCGGKCKRGRCRTGSYEPPVYANQRLLPDKGSREWLDLTANEVVHRYEFQMAVGAHVVQSELRTSIATFSGD